MSAPLQVIAPQTPMPADRVSITWEKFTLSNGLTVIVHKNRVVPLVTVNVWYKVGAKDEKPGKTGLAHLFEHLMFGGSAHMPGSYLDNMGQIGAIDMNGTTNFDRTNFYQTVQTGALDAALFAESDRMGHFLETLNATVLEQQRGVVLNEKEQTEGVPYGKVTECVARGLFPPDHPYAHTTLGWREDVERLTLEDARGWFREHYAPSNAVLVLAGDIDSETARAKAIEFFGDIPPGPPLKRPGRWVPVHRGTRREVLEDKVPFARLLMAWHIPPAGDIDATRLSMAVPMLGGGVSSRLHVRLVERDQLATDVSVGFAPALLSGQIVIAATLPRGGSIAALEAAIRNELDRFRREGPTEHELARVKMHAKANAVRHWQTGQAVADLLAMNEVFFGDPGRYEAEMQVLALIGGQEIREAAARWIGDPDYVLQVLPYPALAVEGNGFDRLAGPLIDPPANPRWPDIADARLSNGMRVLVATRSDLPLVEMRMLFPRGATLEPRDRMGAGRLLADLMVKGAGSRDAATFYSVLESEAISIGTGVGLDFSAARVSVLRSGFELALELMADVTRRPRLEGGSIERVRRLQIEALHGADTAPAAAVAHVLPALMFGQGHDYARVMQGIRETLAAVTRDDLTALHGRIFAPDEATIIAVGDIALEELLPMLESRLGDWPRAGGPPTHCAGEARPAEPGVYLIDRPGATQSAVTAALIIPSVHEVDPLALTAIDMVLGGTFGSRLNMNLREDKSWTYGLRTQIGGGTGPRSYLATGLFQSDRTAAAMVEIAREYRDLIDARPIDSASLARIAQSSIMGLPSRIQTLEALAGSIESLAMLGRPLDHWSSYAERMRALDVDAVNALARRIIRPERLVWVVAGDRGQMEPAIANAGFGPVRVLDVGDRGLYC